MEVNGDRSDTFRLDQGLPQGYSIAPLLYLIFINDIDVDLDANKIYSLIPDNTAIFMSDGDIIGSNRVLMQTEIDKIMAWAEKWKMKVNEGKTKGMVTSSSRSGTPWDPGFTAGGKTIEAVQDYKFLGVTVDNELMFTTHVSLVTAT